MTTSLKLQSRKRLGIVVMSVIQMWFGSFARSARCLGSRRIGRCRSDLWRGLAIAANGLAADPGSDTNEHLSDPFAATDAHRVEKRDELPGHIVFGSARRRRLEKGPDRRLVRFTCRLADPPSDRSGVDHERVGRLLLGEAIGPHEDDDAVAFFRRVTLALGRGHPKDPSANDLEDLTQFVALQLGLTVLGEGSGDGVTRVAPVAEGHGLAEKDELFRPKKKPEGFGREVASGRERGERMSAERPCGRIVRWRVHDDERTFRTESGSPALADSPPRAAVRANGSRCELILTAGGNGRDPSGSVS